MTRCRRLEGHPDADLTFLSEFDGVPKQVRDDLTDSDGVSVHCGRNGGGIVHQKVEPFPLGSFRQLFRRTLDEIAQSGVLFRNTWATPECSPSRVSIFTGRYPLRHNVMAALLPPDLAISQQSPYETTTPNILREAGYTSALFGMHSR